MNRFRSYSSEHLGVMILVYSKPVMRSVFAQQLREMSLELLSRALPDYAEEEGGYLVACPEGVQ